jgi:erythromycin esterase-like protein
MDRRGTMQSKQKLVYTALGCMILLSGVVLLVNPVIDADGGNLVKIEWLSENAVPIRSIDPDDNDFADLMPLKSSLSGVRIVMLGEATHGDGATFYAKQRLVRFLHEVMGFDVLAWEARFFAMEELNRELESGQPIPDFWGVGLMKPMGQYSRTTLKTNRPLRHTGVDIVFGYPRARGIDRYRERLFEFLDAEGSGLASPPDLQMISEFFLTVQREQYSPSEEESANVRAAIGRVRGNLCEKATTVQDHREIEYFAKTLEDLAAYEQHLILSNSFDLPRGLPENISFRGRKMGENLIWLAKEWYPEQKIIVWAANRHVARNVSSIEILRPDSYTVAVQLPPDYREIGDFIYRELGESVYSIGFVTYQGTRGRWQNKPVSIKTVSGSIESLWHHTGHRYSFLDFRSLQREHWLHKPLLAHVDGGVIERTNWTNVFDGMFYIDTMFPDTESGEVPEGVHTKRR